MVVVVWDFSVPSLISSLAISVSPIARPAHRTNPATTQAKMYFLFLRNHDGDCDGVNILLYCHMLKLDCVISLSKACLSNFVLVNT